MMKMKQIGPIGVRSAVAGLAALLASAGAEANDVIVNQTLTGGTTYYGALHTDSADFEDTFNFLDVAGSVLTSVSLTTIGAGAQNIDFLSATLNDVPLTLSGVGFFETGFLNDTVLTGPLVLKIRGRSGAASGVFASYSGTLNVGAVPEPSTAVLMGLGLGGLVLATRRR